MNRVGGEAEIQPWTVSWHCANKWDASVDSWNLSYCSFHVCLLSVFRLPLFCYHNCITRFAGHGTVNSLSVQVALVWICLHISDFLDSERISFFVKRRKNAFSWVNKITGWLKGGIPPFVYHVLRSVTNWVPSPLSDMNLNLTYLLISKPEMQLLPCFH
jgi:hypothetical protein